MFAVGCSSVIQSADQPPQAIAFSSYAEAEAGTVIILDGGNSYDPEGEPVECLWQESMKNPETNLIPEDVETLSPDNCIINIAPSQEGDYVFQLWVSDGLQDSRQPGLVFLRVTPTPPLPNPPPVAIAKADRIQALIDETVILTGAESFDQAGGSLTYFWEEDYQNPVTGLVSPGAVTQALTFTRPGGYLFELTVFNGLAWSRPNSVRVNVDTRVNQVPTADAGEDRNVGFFEEVRLSGGRSYDADGDLLSYHWTQTAGPPVGLLPSPDAEEIAFTVPDEILTFAFSLTVNDGEFSSASDTINIRVWEHAAGNQPDAVFVDRYYPYLDSNGTRTKPYRKIQDGINALAAYPGAVSDVYIARGSYFEKITVADGISLYGGFEPTRGWEHDPQAWPTSVTPIAPPNKGTITTILIPAANERLTYIDGLRIYSPSRISRETYILECHSSNVVIRRNFIKGGSVGENPYGWGVAVGIESASPTILNNIIKAGTSPYFNYGINISSPGKPYSSPHIYNNFIDAGGKSDETSLETYGIYIGTDSRATLINNIINPGLGVVKNTPQNPLGNDNRYGVYESNCSASQAGCPQDFCPDQECNPVLQNNDIIKNDPDACLYYDDDDELSYLYNPGGTFKRLDFIHQVNQLGDKKSSDYSKSNLDLRPIFVGEESGDYHLYVRLDYPGGPTDPVETSPLIDAGTDAGIEFDFDLKPRPNCLLTGDIDCFDIGPDEVYLNY